MREKKKGEIVKEKERKRKSTREKEETDREKRERKKKKVVRRPESVRILLQNLLK